MGIHDVIREKCAAIEPVLRDYARIGDERTQEMIVYPIVSGGKRIRPCLTLLACEAVGADSSLVLSAAASVELLHTFTLVHDDIMDHDAERRGRPTVHSIWGQEMGVIVGDTLYSSSFKALTDVRKKGVSDDRVLDAVEALVQANGELQEGQIMDMLFEGRESVSEAEYMMMVGKKTGALIEASVKIGCIVGGGTKRELEAFTIYGKNCGVAFQVKDDVLDLTADEGALGKPVGSDIRSGKKTLVIVHALANASDDDKDILTSVLGRADAGDDEVGRVIGVLKACGSVDYAEGKVKELIVSAKSALGELGESQAKASLMDLADYIGRRVK